LPITRKSSPTATGAKPARRHRATVQPATATEAPATTPPRCADEPVTASVEPAAPVVRRAEPAAPKAHRARKAAAASAAPAVASEAKADQPANAVSEARLKPASQRATAAAPKARRATARGLPAAEKPIDERVREAVVARLDSMKAIDLVQIDVRGKTTVTDYIVIATGTSTRHVQSMADEVVVAAKKLGMMPLGVEGEKEAEWVLVDLGDTVVHVMLPRTREFYALERLWTMAEESRVTSA
jgi:ribosome silencing factor RsfS/YbeB/iojap